MATPQTAPPSRQRGGSATPEKTVKALGGVTWWLILGFMIISDIGSVLCNLIVTTGVTIAAAGTAATLGLGAIIAIPLGVSISGVGWLAGFIVSLNAFMFSMGYYFFNGVPLMGVRKVATVGVSAIIELLPWVSALPMLTISFLIITITENMKRGKGIMGGVAGKVATKAIAKAGPVGMVAGKILSKI